MRLAFVGKGGAGKSAISGTFARTLARRGRKVFAVDLDTCPGLAFGLGNRDLAGEITRRWYEEGRRRNRRKTDPPEPVPPEEEGGGGGAAG